MEPMLSKNINKKSNESAKKIRMPQILMKSGGKLNLQQIRADFSQQVDYGTDSKKKSNSYGYFGDLDDMRTVIQSCESCMEKISSFITKKPKKNVSKKQGRGTQTSNKPFLVDLIQERVSKICQQNRKLSKLILERDYLIQQKQSQIEEMQDKFTNILYTLGQEICYLKIMRQDIDQIKLSSFSSTDTPSFIKAIFLDQS